MTKFSFELDVSHGFKPYEFFREFKKLQAEGHFDNVKSVLKLDSKTQEASGITIADDSFILDTDSMEFFGVK